MFAASKTASVSGGYQISRSLRFNSADSAYLNRTPASASNRTTWTYSGWIKRSKLGTDQNIFVGNSGASDANFLQIVFVSTDDSLFINGWTTGWKRTSQVFRDVSAWYHIVVVWDTTQATAANRVKLYVNGSQVTAFQTSNDPALNATTGVNAAGNHYISSYNAANQFNDGYMTEVNFIDGQALTPSSFGETNAQTGVWQPKAYSGSYGTNGFYLNFSDNSNTTAATLGKDYSGNGNNWTPNNFSVTAGAGNDSLVDSPTSYGTDTGVGGTVRGNYATLNPLNNPQSATLANGNLDCATPATLFAARTVGTIAVSSGKWYWEFTKTSGPGPLIGIALSSEFTQAAPGVTSTSYGYYAGNGQKYNNNVGTAYGAGYANGDVMGVALDMDAGTLTFYKNNTSQGTAFTGLSGAFVPAFSGDASGTSLVFVANFGQRPFVYTAPSGFKALCTQNLPTPTIGATTATQAGKYFNPVLYTGTGSTRTVTGVNFSPDLVWIKSRSAAYNNRLYDRLRGVENVIQSNSTAAEASDGTGLTAFGSDGFTLGSSVSQNESASTFVAWNWKANGSGSTNTAGSITSTVSANTTSGFSVVTFTSQASGTATVGHGLGVAPSMVIVKGRNVAYEWYTYHVSLGASAYVSLSNTAASASSSTLWNATSPTSSVFSLGTAWTGSNTFVAYCFAEVAGYSKFGSYTGNGSADGPFIYTGFRPAYMLVKLSSASGEGWWVFDNKRNVYNVTNSILSPNSSGAEITGDYGVDFTANGFKIRNAQGFDNASGATYIYAAFAEVPLKFSLAR